MSLFTFRKEPSDENIQYKTEYKEQFIINWINSIKAPQCLLVNDLNDENILNGNIFIDILIEFLSHYSIKTFKPDPSLKRMEKLKLLLLTLNEIYKISNKNQIFFVKKIKYFIKNCNSIYDDKILLIEFFLLIRKFYEQYVNSISITTQSSLISTENNNSPKKNEDFKNNLIKNTKLNNYICINNKRNSFIKRNNQNNLPNKTKKFSNSYENLQYLNNIHLSKMNTNADSKEASKIYNEMNSNSTKNNIFSSRLLNFSHVNNNNYVQFTSTNDRNYKNININNFNTNGSTYRNKISLRNKKKDCFSTNNDTFNDVTNNINKTNINSNKSRKQPIKIIKQISSFNSNLNLNSNNKNIMDKNNIPKSSYKKNKILRKNLIDFYTNRRNSNPKTYNSSFYINLPSDRKKNLLYSNSKINLKKNYSVNKYNNIIITNSQPNLKKITNIITSRKGSQYEFLSGRNFSYLNSFINKKKKVNQNNNKKILNWLIKIGAIENNYNEIILTQKVSRGYFLCNLLVKLREKLFNQKIIDNNKYILKNPFTSMQIRNNFKYFWEILSSFPGVPGSIMNLRKYEDKIISKNEKVIFNLLNELYNYYSQHMEIDI